MHRALAILALFVATPAIAQPIVVADSGDSAWVLTCALLGLLASLGGFILFHGRSRGLVNGSAIFASLAITTIAFAALGYSVMFSDGSPLLGGVSKVMLGNLGDIVDGATVSETVFALFELALALFGVGAMVSSIAPTSRFGWLVPFAGLWAILVYFPVARWVWAGWLGDIGALDYAGGIAVQIPAGIGALVAALLLRGVKAGDDGPRQSRFAGATFIAVGWLALIGGSALGGGAHAAEAILNALLAASAAIVTGLVFSALRRDSYSAETVALHGLAGLAAISAGASLIGTPGAIALGIVAAIVATGALAFATAVKLGRGGTAFAIHGAPAIAGALLFPALMPSIIGGADFAEGNSMAALLAAQGVAVLTVTLWTAIATVLAALVVSIIVPMRRAAD